MSCFGVKKKNKPQPFFGVSIDQAVKHPNNVVENLPYPIWHLLQYLETEKGFHCSGLYRIPGSSVEINQIQKVYDTGGEPKLQKFGISPCASLLKKYFKMLPEPLLTYGEFDNFMKAAEMKDEKERVKEMALCYKRLPKPNQVVLKRLIRHLRNVAAYSHINKMNISNLAIVFAPTLMKGRNETMVQLLKNTPKMTTIVHHLIQDYNEIFGGKKDSGAKKGSTPTPKQKGTTSSNKTKGGKGSKKGSSDEDEDEDEDNDEDDNTKKVSSSSSKKGGGRGESVQIEEEDSDDDEDDELVMINLKQPLETLSKRIRFFRKKANRPNDITQMNFMELRLEKRLIKKELKSFDQVFKYKNGKYPGKTEKEPLRPLYNRYRHVKKRIDVLCSENEDKKQELQRKRELKKRRKERERQRESEMKKRQKERMSKVEEKGTLGRLTTNEEVQKRLMKDTDFVGYLKEKRTLQKKLHEFQKTFEKENGRKISSVEDRRPMEKEYLRYKKIKVEMGRITDKMKKEVQKEL